MQQKHTHWEQSWGVGSKITPASLLALIPVQFVAVTKPQTEWSNWQQTDGSASVPLSGSLRLQYNNRKKRENDSCVNSYLGFPKESTFLTSRFKQFDTWLLRNPQYVLQSGDIAHLNYRSFTWSQSTVEITWKWSFLIYSNCKPTLHLDWEEEKASLMLTKCQILSRRVKLTGPWYAVMSSF